MLHRIYKDHRLGHRAFRDGPVGVFISSAPAIKDQTMFNQFEEFQKYGKENLDLAVKSFGSTSKSVQAIATETADYSKKAFEQSSAVVEKLVGVKTLDKALEIQSDYAKSAYEGYVAFASKVGELITDLARDSAKPYEAIFAKVQASSK